MNKKLCSILIIILIVFAGCKQSVKHDSVAKNINDNKTGAASPAKNNDLVLHTHAATGAKKLSCCIGPPSRVKTK